MSKSVRIVIGALTLVAMSACASKQEKAQDPVAQKEALAQQAQARAQQAEADSQLAQNDAARAQLGQDRDAYVAATQARIVRLTKRSDELHGRAENATGPQKQKLQNISDDYDSALTQVRRDFAQVQKAPPQDYLDQKRSVEKDIGRAEEAFSSSLNVYQAQPAAQ